MSLYLCCDCGGSKTAVAIADASGDVVARATGGPSNFAYQGLTNFIETVKIAIESALQALPASHPYSASIVDGGHKLPTRGPGLFAAAWFGVSGVDSDAVIARLLPPLGELLSLPPSPPRLRVANDTSLLSAPLAEANLQDWNIRSCIGCVGGTGSIAASFRLPSGESVGAPEELGRVGGWGWILGDEGGGFHAGREAIRQLLRADELAILQSSTLEAEFPSELSLRARILTRFGVQSIPEILPLLHDPDPTTEDLTGKSLPAHRLIVREQRLSSLAPLVFEAAFGDSAGHGGGDTLALSVLRTTAATLAEQIEILLLPTSIVSVPSTDLRVAAASSLLSFGGSLVGVPAYQAFVLDALKERGHIFPMVKHVSNAADAGARGLAALFTTTKLTEPVRQVNGIH